MSIEKFHSGIVKTILNFWWRQWGSSLPGQHTLDPLLSPPLKETDIFWLMCLGGGGAYVKKGLESGNNVPRNYWSWQKYLGKLLES
jgi:hypothetical protein